MVVVRDDFDLAPVDAALGVDLVGGELSGLGDRGTRDRLRFGDHADLDRALVLSPSNRADCENERSRAERAAQDGCARRSGFKSRHFILP